MEIFGLHIPGTRDKDAEIAQLQESLRSQLTNEQQRRAYETEDLRKQLRSSREEHHAILHGFTEVRAELERLQELAPFQVRHWDLTVRKACMTLQEALEEASMPGPAGNVYITKREGDHNRMMTAEEISREVSKPDRDREPEQQHPFGEVIELEPPSPDDPSREPTRKELDELMALPKPSYEDLERRGREQQQQEALDRDPAYRQCVAEDRSEQWDRHVADLAYELKGPSEEQLGRIQKAEERAEGRADDHEPEQTRQPSTPRRRELPQAAPPHVLYRQPGPSRGMER
jgi:hypothetical protein